jgi:hypothetical protein
MFDGFPILTALAFDIALVVARIVRFGAGNPHGPSRIGTQGTVHGIRRIEYISP